MGENERSGPVRRRVTREVVLDAAEALLRSEGEAGFSMRALASAAGVSFATPFNQFGSKARIIQALSTRRIALMAERLGPGAPDDDTAERVARAAAIATEVLLADPAANRAVIAALGSASETPGAVSAASAALWSTAIGTGHGLAPELRASALGLLPVQLAIAFRGCLSFWVAGELSDALLPGATRKAALLAVAAFAAPARRRALLAELEARADTD